MTMNLQSVAGRVGPAAVAAVLVLCGAAPAAAEDFYAGKQITLIVGAGVGGGYDHQARLVAHHLSKHIPGNPGIIVENMPAAGGMTATNYLFSTAPQDGSTFALVQRGMLLAKLTYPDHVRPGAARHVFLPKALSRRRALCDRGIPLAVEPQQRDRGSGCMERGRAA